MPHLPEDPEQHTMSFGDHLDELRRRILWAIVVPLPLTIITFFFSNTLIKLLLLPLLKVLHAKGLEPEIQVLSPPEYLVEQLKLSIILALVVSAPWVVWQVWLFIRPGLYNQERRFVRFLIPGSAILTAAGLSLMYFVMLPLMLLVLVGIASGASMPDLNGDPGEVQEHLLRANEGKPIELLISEPEQPADGQVWLLWPEMKLYGASENADGVIEVVQLRPPSPAGVQQIYRLSTYLSFVLILMLGITIAFQMPLVIVLLGWVGLADANWLARNRKYALLVCGIVSAIITPADVVSMLLMLFPLYGLYELGILLLRIAPADAVREGRVFKLPKTRGGSSHKEASSSTDSVRPVQSSTSMPRRQDESEISDSDADDKPGESP